MSTLRDAAEKTTTVNFTVDLHRDSSLSASAENRHIYRCTDNQMNRFEQTRTNFTPQLLSRRTAMYPLINKPLLGSDQTPSAGHTGKTLIVRFSFKTRDENPHSRSAGSRHAVSFPWQPTGSQFLEMTMKNREREYHGNCLEEWNVCPKLLERHFVLQTVDGANMTES